MALFNYSKAGKGVKKEDLEKSGIGLYFDILGRRIWKIITLNLVYLCVSIPAILLAWAISSYFVTFVTDISGIDVIENSDVITIISIILGVVFFQVLGSGPATVSMSHILRRYVKDSHVWIFSDFFEHIKKNFKQGLALYIINVLAGAGLILAIIFYSLIMRNSLGQFLSFAMIITTAFFVLMQMYTYQIAATFDFKIRDIYKNAFLLVMIKLPWNLLVLATIALVMYTVYSLALLSPYVSIIVLAIIYFVLINFTQIFMTNNVVKKYLLEPSLEMEENKKEDNE